VSAPDQRRPDDEASHWTSPFTGSAAYYDALYTRERDYREQATRVATIARELCPDAETLLDVACGTGLHLEHLAREFCCDGLDASEPMLRIAQARNPGMTFHLGNMCGFDTGRRYDVVTCLFSSITYAMDVPGLQGTLRTFADHLVPGGACIVEPFIPLDAWVDELSGHVRHADLPELAVAMVDRATRRGRTVVREVAYAAATPSGIDQVLERHAFALFTADEYMEAFHQAGFHVRHDPQGFDPARGLYLGRLPGPDSANQFEAPA
jgi:SAM-dependent methyltransferase